MENCDGDHRRGYAEADCDARPEGRPARDRGSPAFRTTRPAHNAPGTAGTLCRQALCSAPLSDNTAAATPSAANAVTATPFQPYRSHASPGTYAPSDPTP